MSGERDLYFSGYCVNILFFNAIFFRIDMKELLQRNGLNFKANTFGFVLVQRL